VTIHGNGDHHTLHTLMGALDLVRVLIIYL
jgi:hypothetical protein